MSHIAVVASAEPKTAPTERSEPESSLHTKIERQRTTAQSGDVEQQYKLAVLLMQGTDEQKAEAFALLSELAAAGHIDSKNEIGACYHNGKGVEQDKKKAFECFHEAAELGDTLAQFNLAMCYFHGTGVVKDESKAVEWYSKAASAGDPDAQYSLAVCYRDGVGVGRDEILAFEWMLKSAEQNDPDALCAMGYLYQSGIGCEKDENKAVEMYRKSAERGVSTAHYNLGLCHLHGTGTVQAYAMAFDSFQKAALAGDTNAQLQLARCFAHGHGTEKNIGKALLWLAKAEAAGQKAAVVERMYLRCDGESTEALFEHWNAFGSSARGPVVVPTHSLKTPFRLLQASTFGQAICCQLRVGDVDRQVVVKVSKDQNISEAWINEMLALTALPPHDNVLKLHGICSDFECTDRNGVKLRPPLSFVTEFAAQGSIEDFFRKPENKGAGFSAKFLLSWALDIARGIAHLHKHGCIHRDLAARNVFINERSVAIIGDLGLARPLDKSKGVFKSEHKSAAYPVEAAPQVLQSEEYSPASDVFSFGLTLFEIATECKFVDIFAFSRSSLSAQAAKLEQVAAQGYPELASKVPATVPASMVELMWRCLAFEPDKRPTAIQIVRDLSALIVQQYDVALRLTEGNDEQKCKGVEMLSALVSAGFAPSGLSLGWCYSNGCGVAMDQRKAFECYLDAAKRGVKEAQFNVAVRSLDGKGTEKDEKQALEWLGKCVEQGHPDAMYELAQCYANGVAVDKNAAKAEEWMQKAKAAGYKLAESDESDVENEGDEVNEGDDSQADADDDDDDGYTTVADALRKLVVTGSLI